ncbi:hypothetical protein TNCV_5013881 [Trichonephila clavipes]|nr:hypothetical protein TNCV_5013881 [Trichonephila clavipes]
MSSPVFEPIHYGTAVSAANHYTGWAAYRESVSAHIVSSPTRCRHRIMRKRKHNVTVSPLKVWDSMGKKGQNL